MRMGKKSFAWKALDQDGRVIQGIWELKNSSEVRSQLFLQGVYPLKIHHNQSIFKTVGSFMDQMNKKNASLQIWGSYAKRLSLLLQAGIPLVSAVEILGEADKKGRVYPYAWDRVKEKIEGGVELSEALLVLQPPPTPFFLAMVRAGEQSSNLPQVLEQVALDFEEEYLFRRKLVGAYAYPLFLLSLALGVIYALSVVVLPVYQQIFNSLESELPWMTQVIFRVADSLPWVLGGLLITFFGFSLMMVIRHPKIWREKLKDWLSGIPLVGKLYQLNDGYQFTRVLATLLEAGIPLLEALQLTQGTVQQYEMKKNISYLIDAAREGRRLAPVLRHYRKFPLEASQMLAIGEESGRLSEMLYSMAKIFRIDLEDRMDSLPRILGPILIVIITIMIGAVAIGVLLPIFDVGTHLD